MQMGDIVIFDVPELMALAASGILSVTVGDTVIAEEETYLLRHIREDAAGKVRAVSSSGYELQCVAIGEDKWTWKVTKERDDSPEEE